MVYFHSLDIIIIMRKIKILSDVVTEYKQWFFAFVGLGQSAICFVQRKIIIGWSILIKKIL